MQLGKGERRKEMWKGTEMRRAQSKELVRTVCPKFKLTKAESVANTICNPGGSEDIKGMPPSGHYALLLGTVYFTLRAVSVLVVHAFFPETMWLGEGKPLGALCPGDGGHLFRPRSR